MDSAKRQKGADTYNDRITNLPNDLKLNILACLPLKDAVGTSFLSRKWRYLWASIPNLVFNDKSVMSSPKLTKFVDMVLLLHQGPICKFFLCCRDIAHVPIERWILVLSRNKIEEINISYPSANKIKEMKISRPSPVCWKMPSCFFTIQSLKKVYLRDCILKLPHGFCGLKLVQYLRLYSCTISDDDLEKLVSSCPLLENLYLVAMTAMVVKLNSPNLKLLHIRDGKSLKCIHLITPLLMKAYLLWTTLSDENHSSRKCLIDVLGSLPKIERLSLNRCVVQYLISGCNLELPLKFDHLKSLFVQFNVEVRNEAIFVFNLLRSSPNLQYLSIINYTRSSDAMVPMEIFWDLAMQKKILFEHLKFVTVNFRTSVKESGLLLVKLLLFAAPLLKKVRIENYNKDFEFVKKLVSFKRASTQAEILLVD